MKYHKFQGSLDMGGRIPYNHQSCQLDIWLGVFLLAKMFKFWEVLKKLFKWEKYKRMNF
jgi:hypothetical protein